MSSIVSVLREPENCLPCPLSAAFRRTLPTYFHGKAPTPSHANPFPAESFLSFSCTKRTTSSTWHRWLGTEGHTQPRTPAVLPVGLVRATLLRAAPATATEKSKLSRLVM